MDDQLIERAQIVGEFWEEADDYFALAESEMDARWRDMLSPYLLGFDFSRCVDLAAGHGRNTRKLLEQPGCELVYCVDINESNVEFCRQRFVGNPRVQTLKTNGVAVSEIPDGSITCFYCFDAMVHFDSDVVRSYLAEVRRTLDPEIGRAFLHHSNLSRFPTLGPYRNPANPASRNFMTAELFTHYAHKEGLAVIRQEKIDWLWDRSFIDAFSVLRVAV